MALMSAVGVMALSGWVAQGAAAQPPTAANAKSASTLADFNGTKLAIQVRQSGSNFYLTSFVLVCGSATSVSATKRVALSQSGDFSYSGAATLYSGAKHSRTKLKLRGKIDFTSAHALSSAKHGTATASTTARHCSSFSGKLTGYVVPNG
jgi:hypothetical protein